MNRYKVDFESIEWASPIAGVRHKVYESGTKILRLVEFTPEMELHWCARGHVGRILEGRFEIEFDEETQTFESGDGVFIPTGEAHRHRARAVTDVVTAIFVEDAEAL